MVAGGGGGQFSMLALGRGVASCWVLPQPVKRKQCTPIWGTPPDSRRWGRTGPRGGP